MTSVHKILASIMGYVQAILPPTPAVVPLDILGAIVKPTLTTVPPIFVRMVELVHMGLISTHVTVHLATWGMIVEQT